MKIIAYILEAIYNITGTVLYGFRAFKAKTKLFTDKHITKIGFLCALLFYSILLVASLVMFYKYFPKSVWVLLLMVIILLVGTWFWLFLLKLFIQETSLKYRTYVKTSKKLPFRKGLMEMENLAKTTEGDIQIGKNTIKESQTFENLFVNNEVREKVAALLQQNRIVDEQGNWLSRSLGNGDATAICILLWKLKELRLIQIPNKLTQKELCVLSADFFNLYYDPTMISKIFRELDENEMVTKSNYFPVLKKLSFLDDING